MNQFLTIPQQDAIRYKYYRCIDKVPLRERFCASYGQYLATGVLLAANIVLFRCGFRAFRMMRYNKGRLVTLVMSTSFTLQGSLLHQLLVTDDLVMYYRKEDKWYYGVRSLIGHQFAFPIQSVFALGSTFAIAQLNGMIAVRYGYLEKGRRMETLRFVLKSLKPFSRILAITYLTSSAVMFYIGCREYNDSCNILKYMNRRTLCQKED